MSESRLAPDLSEKRGIKIPHIFFQIGTTRVVIFSSYTPFLNFVFRDRDSIDVWPCLNIGPVYIRPTRI